MDNIFELSKLIIFLDFKFLYLILNSKFILFWTK